MTARLTGFSPRVRQVIKERAGTEGEFVRCESCGQWDRRIQLHHRRARGMGSSRRAGTNDASNAAACCGACHYSIEQFRTEAIKSGWLVPQHRSPNEVPIRMGEQWFLLADDGGKYEVPNPERGVA